MLYECVFKMTTITVAMCCLQSEKRLPNYFSAAQRIIKQLVNGLITIHSRGVFHRDIKLENILVQTGTSAPSIWIIDFGCATLVSDCNNTIQGKASIHRPKVSPLPPSH